MIQQNNSNNKIALGFLRHTDLTESKKIVDEHFNNGFNCFEVCYFYQNFQCENFVYSLLKNRQRETYQIENKLPIHNFIRQKSFQSIYYEQLNKVPGGYFDTYLLQAVSSECLYDIYKYKLIDFFHKEKEKGNIKKFGISIQCDELCLQILLKEYAWDICQMPLNYFDWYLGESKKLYDLLQKNNIPIIAQSPLKGGYLFKIFPYLSEEEILNMAYGFINELNIEMVLIGTTNYNHYLKNYQALNNAYTCDHNFLQKLLKDYQKNSYIDCFNCNQCYDICPQKLPISAYFNLYNKSILDYNSFLDLQILKKTTGEPINKCDLILCDACKNICPLKNNIKHIFANQIFESRL